MSISHGPILLYIMIPILGLLSSLSLSCGDITSSSKGDPRQYKWTSEVISYPGSPQTIMRKMWGAGSTVWAVGHNATSSAGAVWRNDGSAWTLSGFHASEGGPISGVFTFFGVDGIDEDHVFIVGGKLPPILNEQSRDTAFVLERNNGVWKQYILPSNDLYCVDVVHASNIVVGGSDGFLARFDGVAWVEYAQPNPFKSDNLFAGTIVDVASDVDGTLHIIANKQRLATFTSTRYLAQYANGNWLIVDSSQVVDGVATKDFASEAFFMSYDRTLFGRGKGVHRWSGAQWISMFSQTAPITILFGLGERNIFAGTSTEQLFHFNGDNWKELDVHQEENTSGFGPGWALGIRAYVLAQRRSSTPQVTISYKGD